MASELLKNTDSGHTNERDTLLMLGGVALVVVGTGMILSNPVVRRYMAQMGFGDVLGSIIPTWSAISACVPCNVSIARNRDESMAEGTGATWPQIR